ncbi:MAG: hypothetical protein EOM69_08855 [Clostridia bacterium]|nr:hypothetical protein [Clostridia bacterium]
MSEMRVHVIYPEHSKASFFRRNRISILRSAFLFAGYTCLIINLLTSVFPWSLIVIGGLCVLWIALIYRPLVENTLIKKLSDTGIAVCLYLFLLDALLGTNLRDYVVPIVFFGDLILIGCLFLLFFQKQKRNFMPLFELILIGLVAMLCGLVGLRDVNWSLIVVGSVSLGLVVLSFALFPQALTREFRKKLHM